MPGFGDSGDSPCLEIGAIHDGRIHFIATPGAEGSAPAGVEQGIILKDVQGGLNGIETRPTRGQHRSTGFRRPCKSLTIGGVLFRIEPVAGYGASTPMDGYGPAA
jgi:hypothetical protein